MSLALRADHRSSSLAKNKNAAAREQLQVWAERNHVPIIAQQGGAEPAAVIFDALQAAFQRAVKEKSTESLTDLVDAARKTNW